MLLMAAPHRFENRWYPQYNDEKLVNDLRFFADKTRRMRQNRAKRRDVKNIEIGES